MRVYARADYDCIFNLVTESWIFSQPTLHLFTIQFLLDNATLFKMDENFLIRHPDLQNNFTW